MISPLHVCVWSFMKDSCVCFHFYMCVCAVFHEGFLCAFAFTCVCVWSFLKDSCVRFSLHMCVCVVCNEGFLCELSPLHVCVRVVFHEGFLCALSPSAICLLACGPAIHQGAEPSTGTEQVRPPCVECSLPGLPDGAVRNHHLSHVLHDQPH